MSISKIKLLKNLYENNVFVFEEKELKSGKKSPYYCNFRTLLTKPELFSQIIEYIEYVINKYEIQYDLLSGVMTGGLAYCSALSYKLGKRQILCRTDKKTYGMKNLIDGDYSVGDKVLLIEDVLTTGESVLEVIKKMRLRGIEISDVIVLFDRNQEGELILQNEKINVYSLFSFSELINYLDTNQLEDKLTIEQLKFYYDKNVKQKHALLEDHKNKNMSRKELMERDLKLIFENEFNKKLIQIIREKETAVCLSLDLPLWKNGKEILEKVAPYICMVKLHCELILDWDKNTITELKEMAKKFNFLIMQDSKCIDVPHIVEKQLTLTNYTINKWADCITVHWENYMDLRKTSVNIAKEFIGVVEMNTLEHNFTDDYFKTINPLIEPYFAKDTPINYKNTMNCIVSQSRYKKNNNVLKLTPGVVETDEDLKYVDEKRYRTIENAMTRDRNHVVIIGSNLIYADDVLEKSKSCAKLSWYYFNLNFKRLVEYEIPKKNEKNNNSLNNDSNTNDNDGSQKGTEINSNE